MSKYKWVLRKEGNYLDFSDGTTPKLHKAVKFGTKAEAIFARDLLEYDSHLFKPCEAVFFTVQARSHTVRGGACLYRNYYMKETGPQSIYQLQEVGIGEPTKFFTREAAKRAATICKWSLSAPESFEFEILEVTDDSDEVQVGVV